jgi:anti-anti-sigma factor
MGLEQEIMEYVAQKPKSILWDMSGTRYLSSSALRVILIIAKKTKVNGIHFGLFSTTPFVDHVFDMSGLKPILPVYKSEEEAIRAAAAR